MKDGPTMDIHDEFKHIISQKNIRTVFQPIVSLVNAQIIGYEALSRGPHGSSLETPRELFSVAQQLDMLWELELLCRTLAMERAAGILSNSILFLNVDPNIIKDENFKKGFTHEILKQYGLSPQNLIFEITEKTAIEDLKNFRSILDHYKSQGYKIAIDDTGAGYSGLTLLAETHPQYIKIDMELVRNIDKDSLKQALMKTFHQFSIVTGIKIIAEGIETLDELNCLIDIGIEYGQGYLLQRPSEGFLSLSPNIKEAILRRNQQKRRFYSNTPKFISIGEIMRQDPPIYITTTGTEANNIFKHNPNIQGLVVTSNAKPVGLLMRERFFAQIANPYGTAIFMKRPVTLLMDPHPLIVDYDMPLDQVSRLATNRHEDHLYDYIIVTKNEHYCGIVTIKDLLDRTTQIELNMAKHCNPLTGLPGNMIIEENLKIIVDDNVPFAVLYIDIDNFKEYNDVYGFENGDKALLMTADIINRALSDEIMPNAFIGHIGGDDFIAIIHDTEHVETICRHIIKTFDSNVKDLYTEDDKRKGYIITKNRYGIEEQFPLMSLSVAVATNKDRYYTSVENLSEVASSVKKSCKKCQGSCYIIDQVS
jgi:diguanylate cyclase (GGDEF)-like protein